MDWMDLWDEPVVIGHRGLALDSVENSLGAINLAGDVCDAVEIDVRQLADGSLVVFHDETTHRVFDDELVLSEVSFNDISNRKLFNSQFQIPTLTEGLAETDAPFLIELKDGVDVQAVIEAVSEDKQRVCLQSFDPEMVQSACESSSIPCGLLCASEKYRGASGVSEQLIADADNGIEFVNSIGGNFISLPFEMVSEERCSRANDLDISVFVWDITSSDMCQEALDMGASGVILDSMYQWPEFDGW